MLVYNNYFNDQNKTITKVGGNIKDQELPFIASGDTK